MANIELVQGANKKITLGPCGEDLQVLAVLSNTRCTASFGGFIVAGATALATTIKLDESTIGILNRSQLGGGIRAFVPRTGEWILITAISGINATVSRAQLDPGAVATTATIINAAEHINIVPLDAVPVTVTLDTNDLTNQTAIVSITPDQTKIPPATYAFQVTLQDAPSSPTNRRVFTSSLPSDDPYVAPTLTIKEDPNYFGA